MKFRTLSIHGAYHPDSHPDAIPPLHLSTTYEHRNGSDWLYTRMNNPNRDMLEKLVAKLEDGTQACAFASGVAAINAVLQLIPVGSTIVAGNDMYNGARLLLNQSVEWRNFKIEYVDLSLDCDFDALTALKPAMIWIETPSNPHFVISDVRALSSWAKENNCLSVVDCTWLSPVYMQGLELGADVVVHSATKYLSGHSDILAGLTIVKDPTLAARLKSVQISQGAVLSPFDCWLLIRSIKTMDLRVKAQAYSASRIADWLFVQKWVKHVHYLGLLTGKEAQVHRSQTKGNGSMISFIVDADPDEVQRFAASTKLIINATSLGGIESTWEHRFSSEGPLSKTNKQLIRFSVGLEDPEDLLDDIRNAAKAIGVI